MAEEGDSGEKTEKPTGKRIGQARSEGMVGQSTDLNQVVGMLGAFYALGMIMPELWQDILLLVKGALTSRYTHEPLTVPVLQTQFYGLLFLLLPKLALLLFLAAVCGAGCSVIQTKGLFSLKMVKPKFKMISPLAGFKRIFSKGNALNIGKSIAKLCIIGPIAYSAFFQFVPAFLSMMQIPLLQVLPLTADMAGTLFKTIMKYLVLLAILDKGYQYWKNSKNLAMSKQEIKDEAKSTEGDVASRKRIINMGLARARERMLKNVPHADVVVTNPTHIAVALSYSAEPGAAPKVVAKGGDHLAERIKEIARRHGVPVVERKPLARALFKMCEVGQEIPYELFKAVAEILAYVYRLKGRNPLKNRTSTTSGTPGTKGR